MSDIAAKVEQPRIADPDLHNPAQLKNPSFKKAESTMKADCFLFFFLVLF